MKHLWIKCWFSQNLEITVFLLLGFAQNYAQTVSIAFKMA